MKGGEKTSELTVGKKRIDYEEVDLD